MASIDLNQALHVVSGDSPAGLLKVALHLGRGQFLVNEDPISCGPAPATSDLSVWRSTREGFIKDMLVEWPDFSFSEYSDHGLLMNAERLGRETSVIVWAARGLPEQLLLAWTVFLYDRYALDMSNLRVAQFENLRPRQRVLGMGELSSENIRKFCPEPRQLNLDEVEDVRRAWRVYTSNDPEALSRYAAENGPMPSLHQAMSQLVHRYPDAQSGLGVWDERLLHYTLAKGPAAVRVIGYTIAYGDTLDVVGGDYLFLRLMALGRAELAAPLVSITGDARCMRGCEVKLTSFGNEVLAGEANHIETNGIDDWIGGVHLNDEEPVTFRQGDRLILPG